MKTYSLFCFLALAACSNPHTEAVHSCVRSRISVAPLGDGSWKEERRIWDQAQNECEIEVSKREREYRILSQ